MWSDDLDRTLLVVIITLVFVVCFFGICCIIQYRKNLYNPLVSVKKVTTDTGVGTNEENHDNVEMQPPPKFPHFFSVCSIIPSFLTIFSHIF